MNEIAVRDRRGNKRFFIDNALLRGGWGAFIGPYGIAVYNALALHADADNQSGFPSYATIAKLTGMSTRQAIREIDRLVSWNIIEKETRFLDTAGQQTSNTYYLLDQTNWHPWQIVTTCHPPYDSQSLPPMTDSHPPYDSQSPKQDTLEQDSIKQDTIKESAAIEKTPAIKSTPRPPVIPSVKIFVETTGKYALNKAQIKAIESEVGNTPAALEKWGAVVTAWQLAGYKLTNITGMLDWFRNGIPVYKNGNGENGNGKHKPTELGKQISTEEFERQLRG